MKTLTYLGIGVGSTLSLARYGIVNPTDRVQVALNVTCWPVAWGLLVLSYFQEDDE